MGGKEKYINVFGSFTEPFNCRLIMYGMIGSIQINFRVGVAVLSFSGWCGTSSYRAIDAITLDINIEYLIRLLIINKKQQKVHWLNLFSKFSVTECTADHIQHG